MNWHMGLNSIYYKYELSMEQLKKLRLWIPGGTGSVRGESGFE